MHLVATCQVGVASGVSLGVDDAADEPGGTEASGDSGEAEAGEEAEEGLREHWNVCAWAHLVPLPPSSFLVSPAVLRHSIPHLYKHSPSLTNSHTHTYRQHTSKASDITHLLDPSYSPTSTHHDHNQIYINHAGEVHDPDFRLFMPTPMRVFASDLKTTRMRMSLCTACISRLVATPHVCATLRPTHTLPYTTQDSSQLCTTTGSGMPLTSAVR